MLFYGRADEPLTITFALDSAAGGTVVVSATGEADRTLTLTKGTASTTYESFPKGDHDFTFTATPQSVNAGKATLTVTLSQPTTEVKADDLNDPPGNLFKYKGLTLNNGFTRSFRVNAS